MGRFLWDILLCGPHDRDREFSAGEREVIKLLGQWAGYELEQQRFEEHLQGLHGIAQRLLTAETVTEVAEVTIEMSTDVFDLPVSAFWKYDDGDDVLRPVAETDEAVQTVGEVPTFKRGETLYWDSFDSGKIQNYQYLTEQSGAFNLDAKLCLEVHVPCGSHGIIMSSATEPCAFNKIDIESLRLLKALVTEAMTAVKREERLAERTEELNQQNDRLEQFADVVAHDLRNPLSVATGFLEIAEETGDADHFEKVASAHDRIERLIDDLLTLARGEATIEDAEEVSLESIATKAWGYVDTDEATLILTDEVPTVTGDSGRLTQLLENIFRNAIEHGGPDVTVTVGRLNEDNGFYVEDTGSGIPQEKRDEVFQHGVTSSQGGTGFGLSIVADIAEAHGWTVLLTNGTDGGAQFKFKFK